MDNQQRIIPQELFTKAGFEVKTVLVNEILWYGSHPLTGQKTRLFGEMTGVIEAVTNYLNGEKFPSD